MSSLPRTLITIATYNEMENLPLLVEGIHEHAPQADILVIDDNSPDGTGRWCDERSAEDPQLHCLHREGKQGLGTAIIAGMQWAIERDYDFVLNMDADFSHAPEHLPQMLGGMNPTSGKPVDIMIGSRYVPGGKIEGWPLRRHFMSRAVNFYARTLMWLKPRDCSGGYRCYRVSLLKRLDLAGITSRGYSFQEEVLWQARRAGATFAETPITFRDRTRGESKINMGEAWGALWIIFRLGVLPQRQKPPA